MLPPDKVGMGGLGLWGMGLGRVVIGIHITGAYH